MSKSKGSQSKNSSAFNEKVVESSTAFVEKAAAPFQGVVRLSGQDKARLLKLKRGARDVITTLARLASKHGIVFSGGSSEAMVSKMESARILDPLLVDVGTLYETLRDSQLADEGDAWKTATVLYGILSANAKGNKALASELQPVKSWFRIKNRPASKGGTDTGGATAETPPAADPTKAVPQT